MTTTPTITPADRERAIPYLEDSEWHPSEIRSGSADSHWIIQAFATHRTAAVAELQAEVERTYGVLRWLYVNGLSPFHRPAFVESAINTAYDSSRTELPGTPSPRAALNKEPDHGNT